jgi:hypothetical protein
MLLSFSDLRAVLTLFACLCIQRWHGSMMFVVLRILREAVSPKEVLETPFRKPALIWAAFLPLLLHGTSFLSLKCLPTYMYLVHFNLSVHSIPPKWAFFLSLGYESPFFTQIATLKIVKSTYFVPKIWNFVFSWTSKWELAMHIDHLLQFKGTHDIKC